MIAMMPALTLRDTFCKLPDSYRDLFRRAADIIASLKQLELFVYEGSGFMSKVEECLLCLRKIVENNNVESYLKFIESELTLLDMVQQQGLQNPGVNYDRLESSIIDIMKVAYEDGIKKFKDDDTLHVPYIKFCIRVDKKADVVECLMNFLQDDLNNEAVWTMVKKLYFYETDDIRSSMWAVMTDLAGKFVNKIENESEDSGACLKKLGDLFNVCFKYIHCSYFHIALLEGIKNEYLLNKLLEDFKQNVFMWNILAQQVWRVDIKKETTTSIDITRSHKTRLEQSIAKYKEGIAVLLPENRNGLWCLLINFLFSMYENPEMPLSLNYRWSLLKANLTEGMPYLLEAQFLKWLKIEKNESTCLGVSEKAVAVLPNSVKLWRERLKYEFHREDDTGNPRCIFCVAIGHLKQNSLPVWLDMIQYTILTSNQETVDALFWEGAQQCVEVSSKLRAMYLEWLALRKGGIQHVRAMYNLLNCTQPYSKEVHVMMAKLENILADDYDVDMAEKVHTIACSQFSDDIDVRLNYIEFIVSLKTRSYKDLDERLNIACSDSLAALPTHLHDEFISKFKDLKAKALN